MAFELEESLHRAASRLPASGMRPRPAGRRPRRDRGRSRLEPAIQAELESMLQALDRPPVRSIQQRLDAYCRDRGLRPPARSTIYKSFEQIPARSYAVAELPPAAREALYNLDPKGEVPGRQLAFYCLNYGSLDALSFAAGLPWLALYQAARTPGWRPRSRGLLEAIQRARGI